MTEEERKRWIKDVAQYKNSLPKIPEYTCEYLDVIQNSIDKTMDKIAYNKDINSIKRTVKSELTKIKSQIEKIRSDNDDLRTLGKEWYVVVKDILSIE